MYQSQLRTNVLFIAAMVVLLTGIVAQERAWGAVAQFDADQMRKDIEVMESILETRLSFVGDKVGDEPGSEELVLPELADFESSGRPRVEGFYLYDQGVVFTLSLRGLAQPRVIDMDALEARLERAVQSATENPERVAMQLAVIEHRLQEAGIARAYENALAMTGWELEMAEMTPEVAPEPRPEPRHRRESPEQREQRVQELKQRVEELEKQVQETRQRQEEARINAEQYRARVTEELISALANHGDSLSGLKADEYINLILVEGEDAAFHWGNVRTGKPLGIYSVKKSDISQHRLGQITLDEFKTRVLTYE